MGYRAMPTSKTKKLWLGRLDLSSVPSDQLVVAVNKLEVASLREAKLNTDQITSINNNSKLKLKLLGLSLPTGKAVSNYAVLLSAFGKQWVTIKLHFGGVWFYRIAQNLM